MTSARWLSLAVGLDAVIIARRFWTVSAYFMPLVPYRTLSDWITYDPDMFTWYAFIIAGIVGIFMARRNRLALLYWNLWYLAMLAPASFYAPFGSSVERPILITGSIIASIATYCSHRKIKATLAS